jgi:hypothetical protein
MRLQQKAIIIHDKLFIIANLFGEENFTGSIVKTTEWN